LHHFNQRLNSGALTTSSPWWTHLRK